MLSRSRLTGAVCAAVTALSPVLAEAQSTATFAVDRLPMAGAPSDGFAVWRPEMADKTRFFAQLGLGLSVNPLRVDNYVDERNNASKLKGNPLSMQFITYADVGVEFLSRVSVQLAFPFIAYQTGSPTNTTIGTTQLLPQNPVDLRNVAAGDLRLEGRVILFRTEDRAFKLGATAAVLFPTGNRLSFAGDGRVGGSFGLAAEYDFKSAFVTLNAAYKLRPTVVLNELLVSSEVVYAVGAYVPLRKGTIRLGAELFGGFGASPSKDTVYTVPKPTTRSNVGDLDTTPLEWMVNGKMFFTQRRQAYAGLGLGSRLTGGYAPDFRAVAMVGASFGITDTDPKSPGYRYVFEVSDTADRDKDGIPDAVDACPDEPGEMDSDPEKIGCPRYIRRVKGSNEIEVLKRIEFEFDKSTILPESYPILDEVVNLLAANPTIKKMTIEGHTDNQGTPEYNQRLSDDRARSVLNYLVKKGIDAGRLDSKGYGLTRPRATNDTDEGRQRNRRVEFHIIEQIK
jgi:outer membrane protein OmpA-like peptidoglycan-associated protein